MTREEMRKIKESRGYSLAMLSAYTGIPSVTLQKVFSGETKNPRKATLDAIERVLLGEESVYQGKAYTYESERKLAPEKDMMIREPGYVYGSSAINEEDSKDKEQKKEKKPGEFTLEDYYALPDERRVELIDGVFYDMTAPRFVHQDIIGVFYIAIHDFIKKNKGRCKAAVSPVDIQLDCDDRTMVQPDVIIVCDRNKIKGFGVYGAPDFALEVLSPSTRRKDMTLKLCKYEQAGVKEYWVLDPKKKVLITYNFMEEDWTPVIHPLKGKVGMALFDEKLVIDLDEIAASIEEFDR